MAEKIIAACARGAELPDIEDLDIPQDHPGTPLESGDPPTQAQVNSIRAAVMDLTEALVDAGIISPPGD